MKISSVLYKTHQKKAGEFGQKLARCRKKEIDFARLKVFVYRELCDGTLALARPCPSCLQLIRDLGITKIFYTTKDGFAEEHLRKI